MNTAFKSKLSAQAYIQYVSKRNFFSNFKKLKEFNETTIIDLRFSAKSLLC